jgi:RNA polymerase sigma-70 factor (ECF subfamily)
VTTAQRADEFEALRPHLLAVAYRLTGTYADAEDIVQDSWLRWHRADTDVADLRAWLTTVVSRLALDRLRSAAHRRESYVGEWLPEPVVTGFGAGSDDPADPLAAVVAADDARFAAMVVLERLTPDQRVAFVLHDGFGVPFDEIADILGISAASARQLASRARRAAASAPPPDPAHPEIVGKLMAAMADGDMAAVVALLHPEVTFTGDSNRRAPTAARVIVGPDKVARFLFGLAKRYGPNWLSATQLALVNGDLGSYTPGLPAADGFPELAPRVTVMTVRDGLVCAVWDIANPDKFTASPLRDMVTRAASRD